MFINQSQYYSSNLSSDSALTLLQMSSSTEIFKMSTSSATTQSQHQMMVLKTVHDSVQISVNLQTAFRVWDKKWKRNVTVFHCFCQCWKKQNKKTSEKIVKLKSQLQNAVKKRNHYLWERNYFQNVILWCCLSLVMMHKKCHDVQSITSSSLWYLIYYKCCAECASCFLHHIYRLKSEIIQNK